MAGHRLSLAQRSADEDEDTDTEDSRAIVEFSTTTYAVLEREQRVELKIKRRGPLDADIRFRC